MASRILKRSEWNVFFNRVSKGIGDKHAELEVISRDLDDRIETRWLPLFGITYDPKSDVFEIALDGVDHLINRPRDVYVEETPRGLVSVEIAGEDGARQIVRFREPLTLAGASS